MDAIVNVMRRNGILAMFYFAAVACGVAIATWKILPLDTSFLPLYIVTTSQCCLVGLWLTCRSESWLSRFLVPSVVVGLISILRWVTDGMPLLHNNIWLLTYALDGLIPLTGVACCTLLLSITSKHQEIRTHWKMRFSVGDLLFVTAAFAIGTLSVMSFRPNLTQYQYVTGILDLAQQMTASAFLVVTPAVLVFRITQAPVLRIRALTSTILCTLMVGLVTARLLGVDANPLWSGYALLPASSTLLVTFSLLIHRRRFSRGRAAAAYRIASSDV